MNGGNQDYSLTKTSLDQCAILQGNDGQQLGRAAEALTAASAPLLEVANLDNLTKDTTGMSTEENDMSRERRRVKVGLNDDGTPIYKNIQASSTQEMNDRIVREYIESRLIHDMMGAAKGKRYTPFRIYAEKLMEKIKKEKATNTAKAYDSAMKNHIQPAFGDRAVEEITSKEIQAWMEERKEYSKQSVQLYRVILGQALDIAVAEGVISNNPGRDNGLSNPATKETKREALTREQMASIQREIGKLEPVDQCMLALYMTTGMRKGEVLGLRWEDIDFEKNTVDIVRQYDCKNCQIIPPKRGSTGRVGLAEWAKEILLKHRKDNGFVLGVRGGKPMGGETYTRHFKKIKSQIDLFGATGHVFRHTGISMVYHDSKDLSNTQGFARHKNFTTTERYIHPENETVLRFSKVFDSFVNKDTVAV